MLRHIAMIIFVWKESTHRRADTAWHSRRIRNMIALLYYVYTRIIAYTYQPP